MSNHATTTTTTTTTTARNKTTERVDDALAFVRAATAATDEHTRTAAVLVYVSLDGCPYCARFDDAWTTTPPPPTADADADVEPPGVVSEMNLDGVRTVSLRIPRRGAAWDRAKRVFDFRTVPALSLWRRGGGDAAGASSSSSSSSGLSHIAYPSSHRSVHRLLAWTRSAGDVTAHSMDEAIRAVATGPPRPTTIPNVLYAFVRPESDADADADADAERRRVRNREMNDAVRRIDAHCTDDLVQVRRISVHKGREVDRRLGVSSIPALVYVDSHRVAHAPRPGDGDGNGNGGGGGHDATMEWLYRLTYDTPATATTTTTSE
jgi:hypothetical protein